MIAVNPAMKIVIINDMLWGGGRERRIVQLIAGLNRLGLKQITLILLDDRIDYPEVHDLDVNIIKITRKNNRDLSVFPKLRSILSGIGPTLVNPWSYMSVFYAAPVCKLLGIPCLGAFVVDAKAPEAFSVKWFGMHTGFLGCEKIVGNSQAGHEAYGTPVHKRIVIYNGFDEQRLASLKVASEKSDGGNPVQIAMIGRLDRQKDYRTYFDALALLKSRDVRFKAYVAGQGDQLDTLKAYALDRCGDSVIFTGFIRNIDQFIASIDIGVLCTDPIFHAEGISNSILETMAQGRPVVATDGGGTPEIITHGHDGYLVPPRDPKALADRLQELCINGTRRKSLGVNAARTVETKFNLKNMAASFLQAYDDCLYSN